MICVLISANSEWRAVKSYYSPIEKRNSPFGEFFNAEINRQPLLFFQGGWGKVSAAASTQYVIDRWHPNMLINLGTCGGLEGQITVGETVLANSTVFYDVIERMGDPDEAVRFYATQLDLAFIRKPYPQAVHVGGLASADQDIDPTMVDILRDKYQVAAADWESGAIAWVAKRNETRCLILRGVSDIVGARGGEIYNDAAGQFHDRAGQIMTGLLGALPAWIEVIK